MENNLIVANKWDFLKNFTDARIALGRVGGSVPTKANLEFQFAHAQAVDAVHSELDSNKIAQKIHFEINQKSLIVQSNISSKIEYLKRPDLGRKLNEKSRNELLGIKHKAEIGIIIADGLSSKSIENNAIPFLKLFLPLIQDSNISLAPICIAKYSRVALGDEIGELLNVDLMIVLIGERPGLSSPDSMGIYMTFQPKIGKTDESRNCISNIRNGGLSYHDASLKLYNLVLKSLENKISGINLKDDLVLPQ
jgi:ethanolamine ammonia-lyase small subunit